MHRTLVLSLALLGFGLAKATATVAVSPLFGSNMVVQRDKPVPVWGTASPNATVTVGYNSQTVNTTVDAQGRWVLMLAPMGAKTVGSSLTITELGSNTITLSNVVVGDVWLCSGQSNMAWNLNGNRADCLYGGRHLH